MKTIGGLANFKSLVFLVGLLDRVLLLDGVVELAGWEIERAPMGGGINGKCGGA